MVSFLMEAAENIGKDLANKGKYFVWKIEEKQQIISDDICLPYYLYFFLENSLRKEYFKRCIGIEIWQNNAHIFYISIP